MVLEHVLCHHRTGAHHLHTVVESVASFPQKKVTRSEEFFVSKSQRGALSPRGPVPSLRQPYLCDPTFHQAVVCWTHAVPCAASALRAVGLRVEDLARDPHEHQIPYSESVLLEAHAEPTSVTAPAAFAEDVVATRRESSADLPDLVFVRREAFRQTWRDVNLHLPSETHLCMRAPPFPHTDPERGVEKRF